MWPFDHGTGEGTGEAEDGQKAVDLASELRPHIILMDVKMPGMDGIEATRQIHAKMPGIKILALSMYSDNSVISGMMRARAVVYIIKGDDSEEMYKVIRRVAVSRIPDPSERPFS